jgi:hypothetical protein
LLPDFGIGYIRRPTGFLSKDQEVKYLFIIVNQASVDLKEAIGPRAFDRGYALLELFLRLRAQNKPIDTIKRAIARAIGTRPMSGADVTSVLLQIEKIVCETLANDRRKGAALGGRKSDEEVKQTILTSYHRHHAEQPHGALKRAARECGVSVSTVQRVIRASKEYK